MKIIVILTLLGFHLQCKSAFQLEPPAENARNFLVSRIPIGTPESMAKITMEENLFVCYEVRQGEFLAQKNIDYLYCDRSDYKSFLIYRRWQIAFILKNKKVNDIIVSTGILGP